ncbi:hypothetical protein C8R48DRAFT_679086 [Suillus tomentosus]|nr:hypothetical protein C8R48DRAFT_679086 [Suillus tomentosus]
MSQAPPCRTVPGLLFFTPTALSAAGRFPPSYIPSSILLISAVNFIHVWPSNDKGEPTPPLSHVSLPPLRRHRQGIPISPMGLRSYIHNVNHSPRGLNQATLQAPPFYDQLSSYTINIRHRLFARPLVQHNPNEPGFPSHPQLIHYDQVLNTTPQFQTSIGIAVLRI